MTKKNYVLDTSVVVSDSSCIYAFKNNDIIIPFKVLEELDNLKTRQDLVGANARSFIRMMDTYTLTGNLLVGVNIRDGCGDIKILSYNHIEDLDGLNLDWSVADNHIIATASEAWATSDRETILVSRDINVRVKAHSLSLKCQDYNNERIIEDIDNVYSGASVVYVEDCVIDSFYRDEDVFLEEDDLHGVFPNQFIMLISSSHEKRTALASFLSKDKPLDKVFDFSKKEIWGLKSRNKEQTYALNLLLDPDVPVVSLVGLPGGGKTLLALCAGLEQVVENSQYSRLIITRPIQSVGKEVGFLPGTLRDKMLPWMKPISDNLKFLLGGQDDVLEMHMDRGIIEIEAISYIRGRSISDSFIIVDEAQNLTRHEVKTIMTRVGENSKIVLTGDIQQIDSPYLDETTNGLTYVVEKFKVSELSGHVTLKRGERSRVATLASEIL